MELSLNRRTLTDEATLIADLKATFPRSSPKPLRDWSGQPALIGAVVCGEAEMPDGCEIGPYIYPDADEYDGRVHKAFEAWVEARGWYVETYEPGTLWIVPLHAAFNALDRIDAAWFPHPCRPDDGSLPF